MRPIAILDEHPEWSKRLMTALDARGLPFEKYLVSKKDGQRYFYDVNATSNFVADAPTVLGFDPFPAFVDFILKVASRLP